VNAHAQLALESELSGQDIDSVKDDFWKLTDVKAYTKIGIFAPKLKDRQKVLDELSALVAHHGIRIPEEKYLNAYFCHESGYKIYAIRCQILSAFWASCLVACDENCMSTLSFVKWTVMMTLHHLPENI
jgi:hypothetical protein